MSMHSWWTFLVASFLICSTPGPNMLMVMSSSVRHGMRRAFFTMAGCYSGVILLISASVAGLGALLQMEPGIFNTLRYAGAAYLIYLGVQAWRAPVSTAATAEMENADRLASAKTIYGKGFFVGISNPKAILFAAAFFPQFINPGMPKLPQFLILLATFSVAEFCCYLTYATGGSTLATYLRRDNIKKAFNRVTGGLFSAFGVMLLCSKV